MRFNIERELRFVHTSNDFEHILITGESSSSSEERDWKILRVFNKM